MTKGIVGLALSALLLGSTALPALADNDHRWRGGNWNNNGMHRGWYRNGRGEDMDAHARFGLNNRGAWNPPVFDGANAAAVAQFDARVAQVRGDIGARVARGAINPVQAARLNARLDQLLSMRSQFGATGGALTGNELGELNARLNELRIGLRSRIYF